MLVYLDFETYYDAEYSLRKMPVCSYVRDPRFEVMGVGLYIPSKMGEVAYVHADDPKMVPLLKSIPWDEVTLVCHNTKFDGFILAFKYGLIPKRYVDTMDMARAVIGGKLKSFSLEAVAKYCGFADGKIKGVLADVKGKHLQDLTPELRKKLGEYGVVDVVLLMGVLNWMIEVAGGVYSFEGVTQEDWIMDTVVRMFCCPALELDYYLLEQIHGDEVEQANKIVEATGLTHTQLRSSVKFKAELEKLGVEVGLKRSLTPTAIKKKKATGEDTYTPALAKTDDFFLSLFDHYDERVVQLAEARQAVNSNITRTRARSYADVAGEGPWPVDLRYSGATVTHRLSGASGGGGNPQNLGRGSKLRDAIMAPEDKSIVVADLSAIELRTSACIAGQRDLVERIRAYDANPLSSDNPNGVKDAYVQFAEGSVFERELSKDKDQYKIERTTGKVSILSCGYGSGGDTFRGMLRQMSGGVIKVTPARAKELVDIYRGAHPYYVSMWRYLDDYVLARMANPNAQPEGVEQFRADIPLWIDYRGQRIIGHSGLSIKYPDLRREKRYNPFLDKEMDQYVYTDRTKGGEAFIYGPKMLGNLSQFTAREVIMYQTLQVRQRYDIHLSVHDENACVVWDQDAPECLRYMLEVMTTPLPWWPDLPLKAEGDIAKRYGDAK